MMLRQARAIRTRARPPRRRCVASWMWAESCSTGPDRARTAWRPARVRPRPATAPPTLGSALNGKPDGFGTVDGPGYYYQGEYRNGMPHGSGIVLGPDGQYLRAEFRDGYQHGESTPVEGAADGDPWADWEDDAATAAPGPADGADPWRDDAGTAVDDPWTPADPAEDPWARDGAVAGPGSGIADPVVERVPSVPAASDFDYSAALDALEDTGETGHDALPMDDYTARLSEIEHLEAEQRAAEEAREAERRAELQREEEQARYEAEQAERRAALKRETIDSWSGSDNSYEYDSYESTYDTDEYESDSSDSTLFGGGAAGQQAFEEMLQGNIPSIYDVGPSYDPGGSTFSGDDGPISRRGSGSYDGPCSPRCGIQ